MSTDHDNLHIVFGFSISDVRVRVKNVRLSIIVKNFTDITVILEVQHCPLMECEAQMWKDLDRFRQRNLIYYHIYYILNMFSLCMKCYPTGVFYWNIKNSAFFQLSSHCILKQLCNFHTHRHTGDSDMNLPNSLTLFFLDTADISVLNLWNLGKILRCNQLGMKCSIRCTIFSQILSVVKLK